MRRTFLAISMITVLAVAPGGCGDDETAPTGSPSGGPVETTRPELAFFTTHGNAIYDLALVDDRGQGRVLLSGESKPGTIIPELFTFSSWSPDGRRLVFSGGKDEQAGGLDDITDLYLIDADGSNTTRLTDTGDAERPLWSLDGETIVFTRLEFKGGQDLSGSLWSIGVDGSNLTELRSAEKLEIYTAGSFAPNGSQLAVTRSLLSLGQQLKVRSSIELMSADGSDSETLIATGADPAFSPDGSRIAYVSDADRNGRLCYGDRCFFGGELYVANADGSDRERLTNSEALNEARPSWLPDGSRIAYQRGEVFQNAEATSILESNPDGSCSRIVLKGSGRGAWYASPAWRPSEPEMGGGRLHC